MAASYELTAQNITDTTAEILVTDSGLAVEAVTVDMTGGITSVATDGNGIASFTGLTPSTTYTASVTEGNTFSTTFTTKATGYDNPKTATQEQWEDLASRIKSKADVSNVPTITMTTTDPGEGSALPANHYVAVYGGDPIIMDYSTTEINTGARWINGSAIYKKTVNFGALPDNGDKDVAHGISNLSTVVDIKGIVSTQDGYFLPINMPTTTTQTSQIRCVANATNVRVSTGSDRTGNTAYVTLYYTKSS